jgi:hypothetical protein
MRGTILVELALALVVTVPCCVEAQQSAAPVPMCKKSEFFLTPTFVKGSDDLFTIVFDARNISEHVCKLDGRIPAGPMSPGYGFHPNLLPDLLDSGKEQLVLQPGETGNFAYSWKTMPGDPSIVCVESRTIFGPILIVAPTLLPQVCSKINLRGYFAGRFVSAADEDNTLDLFAPKESFVDKEYFYLQASRKLGAGYSEGEPVIPFIASQSQKVDFPVYLWHRSPDGETRLDEMAAYVVPCFGSRAPTTTGANGQPCIQVDSGVGSRWTGTGDHDFQVYERIGSATDSPMQFRTSQLLKVLVTDPASIQRTWQGRVGGLAVDITLDKAVYAVGDDIPIHIAVENMAVDAPVYGWDPSWDPGQAIGIELFDAQGKVVPETVLRNFGFMSGHGFGPRLLFLKGKLVAIERRYSDSRRDPLMPGSYTIVVSWHPIVGSAGIATTVQARATIEIEP